MKKCMRTIVLKLYKPGRGKRTIIDEAMQNYAKAYQFLLDRAQIDLDNIRLHYADKSGRYKASYIGNWIDKDIDKKLNEYSIEPFKDSIKIDFSGAIAEYLNIISKGNFSSYPSAYLTCEEVEMQYNRLMYSAIESINYPAKLENKIVKLLTKNEKLRPLFFCRNATNRNYSLLYDERKDRYYAKIYLLNSLSQSRKKPIEDFNNELVYINKNKETFLERGCKRTFLMFPLAFGKWQEKFLKEAIENTGIIKTARLIKRNDEYFLAINIVKDRPALIEIENYMGISRGIDNAISYSIVDKAGNPICSGSYNDDNKHKIVNDLVIIALKYKCRVIMEKLIDKGDNLKWVNKSGKSYMPAMDCIEYNNMVNILKYKLPDSGLPSLVRVSSINIFYSCPTCGVSSKVNRFSSKILMCTSCGTTMDIEKVGSLNLAKRLIKYNKDTVKIIVETTLEGIKFTNKDLNFVYFPSNPYDCADEFKKEIDNTIKTFYDNIESESMDENFKKKFSIIKKIESSMHSEIFELISIS